MQEHATQPGWWHRAQAAATDWLLKPKARREPGLRQRAISHVGGTSDPPRIWQQQRPTPEDSEDESSVFWVKRRHGYCHPPRQLSDTMAPPTFFNMTKGSKTLSGWNGNDSSQRNLTKSLQRRSRDLENYEGIGCKWLQLNIKLTLKNRVSFRWRTKYECIINWGDARRTMPIEKWGVSERI